MKRSPAVTVAARRSGGLAELTSRFFDGWMDAEPEEATSLGMSRAAPRLRDPSPAAAEAEGQRCAAALRELDAIAPSSFTAEDALDAWALRAHATERVLAAERGLAETRLEDVPYAVAMLAHVAARASSDEERRLLTSRLEGLPRHVADAQAALARGVAAGRPYSTAVARLIADQLASAREDLAAIVTTAFAAAPQHRDRAAAATAADGAVTSILGFATFLREVVSTSPSAREVVPLGEAEYDRRLASWWGIEASRAVLTARARAELEQAQAEMRDRAARIAPAVQGAPARVATFADARAVVDRLLAEVPTSADDVVALYEREIARATAFCRAHGTFSIPVECHCPVVRSPEMWRRFAVCTNWPAPLLAGRGGGACAVVVDPALHPTVAGPNLAVHEAVPGHYLQSRAWQIRFGGARAPVRFLGVPDECGVLRDAWIPHFMIEGWAVFAETRMEEAGFFDERGALFRSFVRTIHAARALADIGLHTEEWSAEDVARFSAAATGMPASFTAAQGVRYARSGMQALGYLFGRLGIEDLRDEEKARLGPRFDDLAFHATLLDAGPAPPGLLRAFCRSRQP
jgi:uncharacterized protein (DUF885 family)